MIIRNYFYINSRQNERTSSSDQAIYGVAIDKVYLGSIADNHKINKHLITLCLSSE